MLLLLNQIIFPMGIYVYFSFPLKLKLPEGTLSYGSATLRTRSCTQCILSPSSKIGNLLHVYHFWLGSFTESVRIGIT